MSFNFILGIVEINVAYGREGDGPRKPCKTGTLWDGKGWELSKPCGKWGRRVQVNPVRREVVGSK